MGKEKLAQKDEKRMLEFERANFPIGTQHSMADVRGKLKCNRVPVKVYHCNGTRGEGEIIRNYHDGFILRENPTDREQYPPLASYVIYGDKSPVALEVRLNRKNRVE